MFPWNKMFPFPKEYMKEDIFKQSDVEKLMKKAMGGHLPPNPGKLMQSHDFFEQSFDLLNRVQEKKKQKKKPNFQSDVFETHEDVIVRFPLTSEEKLGELVIYHDASTCYLENVPNSGNKQEIKLPCMVKSSGSIAKYKNGILEIRIPKETNTAKTKVPIEIIKPSKKK
ncbi:hypothetical protein LC085_14255 [Bacillus tianshenii]|uniref:hypothetical protein n=1 Tax=Sutcliffiella tianshenii TaxID=1463404 RepID=UPI001CD4DAAE|nr:hypothetical protein [Bacillus tianshenii]MCA1321081.1 hypothetical protein [Bacillus tianshenii]